MKLTHCCIITKNVKILGEFYKAVLRIEPDLYGSDYAEFHTQGGTVALFSQEGQDRLVERSMKGASNKSMMLEFEVNDVDAEYLRLGKMDIKWVKHPTTQPWGTRSIYFSDPDGNLINFYRRVNG